MIYLTGVWEFRGTDNTLIPCASILFLVSQAKEMHAMVTLLIVAGSEPLNAASTTLKLK